MIDEYFNPPQSVVSLVPAAAAPRHVDLISTPSSTSVDQDESSASNGYEDLGKLKPKADSGIFVEYAPTKKACRIYNMQTRLIMETMHVEFDELTAMASEQFVPAAAAPRPADLISTPSSTSIDQDESFAYTSPTQETQSSIIHYSVEE
ncbi:hypothetical protein Tco_1144529 [Tanacetum coccineum]